MTRSEAVIPEPVLEPARTRRENFNRLAHIYRWAEWCTFGPNLSKCRRTFLPEMNNRQCALIIGDGDGRFTAQLLRQNPHIEIDAVDASKAMLLALARRAKSNAVRLRTYSVDARDFNPASSRHDLVVTHFFLDCLSTDEIARLATRVRENVNEGTLWVVSEFAVPKTRFGRLVAQPLVAALYIAFGILTGLKIRQLPEHQEALARAGFRLAVRRERLFGLLVSELWQADSR